MKQRPTGLSLSKATVSGYDRDLKLWIEYQGDVDVAAVQTTHILAYLNYLRTDYVPRRITGNNDKKLSPKTVYNLYITVASFFTWASREFNLNNPSSCRMLTAGFERAHIHSVAQVNLYVLY